MFCSMMWPHHKIKSFVPRNPWLLQNKNYSDHDKLWLRSHWLGRFSDQFSKDICILALPAGYGEPASLRVLHMETCWWSQWAYSWMTGWSLWGGSIVLTSFSDFALGLLSDYSRANCTRGATADNVMADTMKEGLWFITDGLIKTLLSWQTTNCSPDCLWL